MSLKRLFKQALNSRQKYFCGLLFAVLTLKAAVARPPQESEFLAAKSIGEDVSSWLVGLPNGPKAVGIFAVHVNAPLEQDYGDLVESEIVKDVRNNGQINITSCPECRTPQIKVQDDRLVITKGGPDLDTLRSLGKKLGVDTFLVLDIYRTKLAVITQATLYQTGNADVLAADQFREPAIDFNDAAMQFALDAGLGLVISSPATNPLIGGIGTTPDVPFSVELLALEELGFGKGGVAIGGVFGGNSGTFGYLVPTLGLRGRFGGSAVTYLAELGAGFGMSGDGKGVAVRGGFDVFLGTFTFVGLDGVYLFPLKAATTAMGGYAGAHVGLSLGR